MYSNVATPRFIVDWMQWFGALGLTTKYTLNPSGGNPLEFDIPSGFPFKHINIWGILGHRLGSHRDSISDQAYLFLDASDGNNETNAEFTNDIIVNAENHVNVIKVVNDGFSFITLNSNDINPNKIKIYSSPSNIGSVISSMLVGRYFNMPVSPLLSLDFNITYGGTKEFTSYTGASGSNTMYDSAPDWGNGLYIYDSLNLFPPMGAWELIEPNTESINPIFKRSGRKSWNLKFSYINNSDLYGANHSLSTYLESQGDIPDTELLEGDFLNNLLGGGNFFSEVWIPTLQGKLPFVFQPDKTNNTSEGFALARFTQGSLQAKRSSVNTYDISLKIEEVF